MITCSKCGEEILLGDTVVRQGGPHMRCSNRLNIKNTPVRPSTMDTSGTLYYCDDCECYLSTELRGDMGLFRHVRMHRLIRMREITKQSFDRGTRYVSLNKIPFSGVVSSESCLRNGQRKSCPHEIDSKFVDICYGYCKGLRKN
jgi:hypothetical protein